MKRIVTPGCVNSIDRFRLADMQQIFSVLDALTRYQPYLLLEAVVCLNNIQMYFFIHLIELVYIIVIGI